MTNHPSRRPSELNSLLTEGSPGFDSPSGSVLIITIIIIIYIIILIIIIVITIIIMTFNVSDNDTTELKVKSLINFKEQNAIVVILIAPQVCFQHYAWRFSQEKVSLEFCNIECIYFMLLELVL